MEHQKQDIFTYLPPDIITEILSRLPVQTILRCKCVCKSWRHLFETRDFAKSHNSNSLVRDGIAFARESDFSLFIEGSVDGLLLLMKYEGRKKCKLHLYNPITREYIDLLHPHSHSKSFKAYTLVYGFGVSKITGQYKVVGIFPFQTPKEGGKVYTIGTRSWRSIAPQAKVCYNKATKGEFLNGNLHWITSGVNDKLWISCFDLETEIFNEFSLPVETDPINMRIAVMEDTLCICVYTHRYADHINIWLMKEYGVENSWTRQFIIERNYDIWNDNRIHPFRISKDGVILLSNGRSIYYYSSEDREVTMANWNVQGASQLHSYTPSFLLPECFKMENVLSLGFFKVGLYLDY